MMNNKLPSYFIGFLYIVTLFSSTQGLGLRDTQNDSDGLGFGSIGFYGFLQIVTLIMMLYAMFADRKKYSLRYSKIGNLCKWYLFLYILICFELPLQVLLKCNAGSDYYSFTNLAKLRFVLSFFIVILVARYVGRTILFKIISACAIVAAVIALYVVLFNVQNTGISINTNEYDITHSLKIMIPTGLLAAFGYFYFIISFLKKKKIVFLGAAILCFVTVLIQLHRSIMASLILSNFLLLLTYGKFSLKKIIISSLGILLFLFLALYTFDIIGYSGSSFMENVSETRNGIITGEDNNAIIRFDMLYKAIIFSCSSYTIFGIGLAWEPLNFEKYLRTHFTQAPVYDNGYYNVIMVFGILGFILFCIMVSTSIYSMIKILKKKHTTVNFQIHSYTLIYTLIFYLLTALGGDSFMIYPPSTTMFFSTIALSHILIIDYYVLSHYHHHR